MSFQDAVIVISELTLIFSPTLFLFLSPETIQASKTLPSGATNVFCGNSTSSFSVTVWDGIFPLPPFASKVTVYFFWLTSSNTGSISISSLVRNICPGFWVTPLTFQPMNFLFASTFPLYSGRTKSSPCFTLSSFPFTFTFTSLFSTSVISSLSKSNSNIFTLVFLA